MLRSSYNHLASRANKSIRVSTDYAAVSEANLSRGKVFKEEVSIDFSEDGRDSNVAIRGSKAFNVSKKPPLPKPPMPEEPKSSL